MYDPTVGRFISEDPIGLLDDVNLHRYVKNSPTNMVDPSGLSGKWISPDLTEGVPHNSFFMFDEPIEIPGGSKVIGVTVVNGAAVFDSYIPTVNGKLMEVTIEFDLDGIHDKNARSGHDSLADAEAGRVCGQSEAKVRDFRKSGYTWHHDQRDMEVIYDTDGKASRVRMRMQLVPSSIHNSTMGGLAHTGGISYAKRIAGQTRQTVAGLIGSSNKFTLAKKGDVPATRTGGPAQRYLNFMLGLNILAALIGAENTADAIEKGTPEFKNLLEESCRLAEATKAGRRGPQYDLDVQAMQNHVNNFIKSAKMSSEVEAAAILTLRNVIFEKVIGDAR